MFRSARPCLKDEISVDVISRSADVGGMSLAAMAYVRKRFGIVARWSTEAL